MARVLIDDALIEKMQKTLDTNDGAAKISEEALTLLYWAANEVKSGRAIVSVDMTGQDKAIHKLAMPALMKLEAA
ncbi:hypothetical protein HNQ59_001263 [Chitinivorax tropicus]|uniref:Uncharacterized protein n=1 Tax=Chitinivorax tropicus TaxID=714531 RepID=A0A840MH52_9PROT|nr:hypothetical protein [Chitinivorax tropicus]MBB5017978.1 hypothetical protein [Chitinivorax tropicus]